MELDDLARTELRAASQETMLRIGAEHVADQVRRVVTLAQQPRRRDAEVK